MLQHALPERVAPLLAPGLRSEVVLRLMRSPRLAARCTAWLEAALGEADFAVLPDDEQALASADTETLHRAAVLAGAVWHAPRIRTLVLARDIAAFIERFGEPARDVALRHAALAPAPDAALPLEAAIGHDGGACVTAWIAALPDGVDRRLRLMLAPADEVPPGPAHHERGPAIVSAIATEAVA